MCLALRLSLFRLRCSLLHMASVTRRTAGAWAVPAPEKWYGVLQEYVTAMFCQSKLKSNSQNDKSKASRLNVSGRIVSPD